ncbi:GNAT family N-acetyltransferase [Chamaesiphon sp. VAR_69_metabat_338]|uniref:GNAT family N-acetyltransferase n=1 Tax=Chamaesiphon sp. VAR_69_metabat_338 TaxID=2964704 RepID=UPI00286E4E15|nr:GNAT family N-acetyltransferase [Chamaesiphon sp. VAR_69_metabat_338]
MRLHKFDSIDKFWDKTQDYLLQNEAENNVLLGVVQTLRSNSDRYPDPPYLAVVEINDEIVATAIRTPPYKLLLSKASNLEALTLIAQDLDREQLPGVMGLVPDVETFLQAWQKLTGQSHQLSFVNKIHQIGTVQTVAAISGYLRLATERDRALLMEWIPAFIAEIGETMGQDLDRIVDNRLKTQSTYIWEDGLPVSLAAGRQRSPTVGLIGSVYTPPAHRRKGYATACVAALSQKLLAEGCDRCFLLTDSANPTSNHIYQEIGYVPICDWHEYSFSSPDLRS